MNHVMLAEPLADALQLNSRHNYLTAPNDNPRARFRWLIQPKSRIGATANVDAADSFAQNNPSGSAKEAVKAVSVAALTVVRFRLQNDSFQQRIIDKRAVAAMPGAESGSSTYSSSSSCE